GILLARGDFRENSSWPATAVDTLVIGNREFREPAMSVTEKPSRPLGGAGRPPLLVAGQRLDRATFHERYEALPPGTCAELIGGIVYIHGRVSRWHGKTSAIVITWLGMYWRRTPGVQVLAHGSTALDDWGEPQPDAQLRILPECGGQTRDDERYVVGAPELVA